ncbi:hypothetical protein [Nocardioides sp. LHG3406-4]|uniref:hypothetical protein n=1 Tax=Nocardioides sp. LHG3406-4 TaxID=2804575 RepID=UPI003CF5DA5A
MTLQKHSGTPYASSKETVTARSQTHRLRAVATRHEGLTVDGSRGPCSCREPARPDLASGVGLSVGIGPREPHVAAAQGGGRDGESYGGNGPPHQSPLAQLFDGEEGEHHRGKAAWTEPAHEEDASAVQARPQESQRDREHAHDGEAEDGVDHHGQVEGVEDHRHECRSELRACDSVEDLTEIDVDSGTALTDLESSLAAVEDNIADVRADAESEFAEPLDAVESSFAALKTSVDAAVTAASATTLSAAGSALSKFGTDVKTLIDDIQSTC